MMRKNILLKITCVLVLFAFQCKLGGNFGVMGVRSGTVNDDQVEEPLSTFAKKYENALTVSNKAIDSLVANNYDLASQDLVDDKVKNLMTAEKIKAAMEKVKKAFGKIKGYKRMQWGFVPKLIKGERHLYSVKIVEHEKAQCHYIFTFLDDGHYLKIIGLHIQKRTGVRQANEI